MENEIKFRDYPILMWLFGLISTGFCIYSLVANFSPQALIMGISIAALGFLPLIFFYALTIAADRQTRMLTLDYRSLLLHSVNEIRFDDIASIRVDSRRSSGDGHNTVYCILAELKNGETIPFRAYYSSGSFGKQKSWTVCASLLDCPTLLTRPRKEFSAPRQRSGQ